MKTQTAGQTDKKLLTRKKRKLGFLLIVLFSFVSACQTSPTGRKQMAFIPESQVDEMGIQAFREMKTKQPINRNPATNNYVQCIANAITKTFGEERPWEVVVFESDQVNAFALPGGKIGVYTGLLKIAKTPDQLATVIGHEVGHVIAQHGRERISNQLAAQGLLTLTSAMMRNRDSGSYQMIMAALGLGAQIGVLLPFGRAQETEADVIGIHLMAKAGFDPKQSIELWKNMAQVGGPQPPPFLSTHPSHDSRIRGLEGQMPQALAFYSAVPARAACHQ